MSSSIGLVPAWAQKRAQALLERYHDVELQTAHLVWSADARRLRADALRAYTDACETARRLDAGEGLDEYPMGGAGAPRRGDYAELVSRFPAGLSADEVRQAVDHGLALWIFGPKIVAARDYAAAFDAAYGLPKAEALGSGLTPPRKVLL